MHHYATNTCEHLFLGPQQSRVWKYDIPALGGSNATLVHGFLAVTAIHCAWKEPARRDLYRNRALNHHSLSLPMFQAMVASASPETAEIIVAYSILLSIWVYAFPELAAEQPSLDDILDMIEVIRASRTASRLFREDILKSPMRIFLIRPPLTTHILGVREFSVRQTLQHLHDQVEHVSDKLAMQQLQLHLDQYIAGPDHDRLAATWMASVANDYWARLRDHCPDAVLVFAYSTILISPLENKCWWMTGWSRRILQACSSILRSEPNATSSWTYHEHQIQTGANELADLLRSRQ